MFWFCKPKPINLYFYTTREDVFNHARPKKAMEFFPNWIKNLPRPEINTHPQGKLLHKINIKTCPALVNLYSIGFIVPLWSDLNVEINEQNYRYQFADNLSEISSHPIQQMLGSGFNETHAHIKIINPWYIFSDSDINISITAPIWNDFGADDIVVAPGVLNPFVSPIDLNINLFFKIQKEPTVYTLFFNQPLLHAVPLTERKVKLNYELVTPAELNSIISRRPIRLMHLNRYWRTKKLCPHG